MCAMLNGVYVIYICTLESSDDTDEVHYNGAVNKLSPLNLRHVKAEGTTDISASFT